MTDTQTSCSVFQQSINDYSLGRCIAHGRHSVIRSAVHKLTGIEIAIKIYEKRNDCVIMHKKLMRIFDILRRCSSCDTQEQSNFLRYFEVFENEDAYFVVMELASCEIGVKLDQINDNNFKSIIKDVISAVLKIHKSGYFHGKLKLASFIWDSNHKVKFKDVHRCRKFHQHRGAHFIGDKDKDTLIHNKLKSLDAWSVGKIIFDLLKYKMAPSNPSFCLNTENSGGIVKVKKLREDLFAKIIPQLSSDSNLLDLLARLLNCDPFKRIHLAAALDHPWFYNADELHPDTRTLQFESVQRQAALNINQDVVKLVADMIGNSQQDVRDAVLTNQLNKASSLYWFTIERGNSSPLSEAFKVNEKMKLSEKSNTHATENNSLIGPEMKNSDAAECLSFSSREKVTVNEGCESGKLNLSKPKIKIANYRSSLISLRQHRLCQKPTFVESKNNVTTKTCPNYKCVVPTITTFQNDSFQHHAKHIAVNLIDKPAAIKNDKVEYFKVKKPSSSYLLIPKFESISLSHLSLANPSSTPLYALKYVEQVHRQETVKTSPPHFQAWVTLKHDSLTARRNYSRQKSRNRRSSVEYLSDNCQQSAEDYSNRSQTSFLTF